MLLQYLNKTEVVESRTKSKIRWKCCWGKEEDEGEIKVQIAYCVDLLRDLRGGVELFEFLEYIYIIL